MRQPINDNLRVDYGLDFQGDTLGLDWTQGDFHLSGYPFPASQMAIIPAKVSQRLNNARLATVAVDARHVLADRERCRQHGRGWRERRVQVAVERGGVDDLLGDEGADEPLRVEQGGLIPG